MSYANQNIVHIAKRRPWGHKEKEMRDKDTFGRFHIDAAQKARKALKAETFIMWMIINAWADEKNMELSCANFVKNWGFAERTYYRAKKELMDAGYLVLSKEESNILYFFEDGLPNWQDCQNDIDNVKTLDCQNDTAAKLTEVPAKMTEPSAKLTGEILHNTTINNNYSGYAANIEYEWEED